MPLDLALLSTLIGSNYPCLELIVMVPKVFEPLKFDCTYTSNKSLLFLHSKWVFHWCLRKCAQLLKERRCSLRSIFLSFLCSLRSIFLSFLCSLRSIFLSLVVDSSLERLYHPGKQKEHMKFISLCKKGGKKIKKCTHILSKLSKIKMNKNNNKSVNGGKIQECTHACFLIQSTLVISTSVISNNRLSRRENLILVLT